MSRDIELRRLVRDLVWSLDKTGLGGSSSQGAMLRLMRDEACRLADIPTKDENDAVKEFCKVVKCLALELPESVWNDVEHKWKEVLTKDDDDAIKEFCKVVKCLVLELPESVWNDVDQTWKAVLTEKAPHLLESMKWRKV